MNKQGNIHIDTAPYNKAIHLFYKDLAIELGEPDNLLKAKRITQAVCKALRDRITIEESVNLLAILPEFLRPVYGQHWEMTRQPEQFINLQDFIGELMKVDGEDAAEDLFTEEKAIGVIQDFFRILTRYVNDNQRYELGRILPDCLQDIWSETALN